MNTIKYYTYFIRFFDSKDNIVAEIKQPDKDTAMRLYQEILGDDNHPMWPVDEAVEVGVTEKCEEVRPLYGVHYGPGSVKNRFGGGCVPRSAYQFKE